MKHTVYLDYAAATPMHPDVKAVMEPFYSDAFYNPSALYLQAKSVRSALEAARASVAKNLGVRSSEITFTAGGTEANNLFIHGIMKQFPGAEMIALATEHDSVLVPGAVYSLKLALVEKDGRVDIGALAELITDQTVLISVGYVNNEIGTVQPLSEIAKIVQGVRTDRMKAGNTTPLYLHTDACQAGNYLSLQVAKLGVDALTLNGGKLYGPKQSGALYVRAGIDVAPLISGGGQEHGLRSGTENVAGSVGCAKALEIAQKNRSEITKSMKQLQAYFLTQIKKEIPGLIVNGSVTHRIANNLHITIPGKDNERLMMGLDERGVICAVGSACSASKDEPSHVLKAIGVSDQNARSSLRFSMGEQTTEESIRFTIRKLKELL